MALNRSSEFKSSHPEQQSFLVPEATISANSEELNYAIHYTNFRAPEPSGSETEDFFFILPMYFYVSTPGAPGVRPCWTLRP